MDGYDEGDTDEEYGDFNPWLDPVDGEEYDPYDLDPPEYYDEEHGHDDEHPDHEALAERCLAFHRCVTLSIVLPLQVLSIRRKGTKTEPGGISIEQELELIRGSADKPGNCSPVTVDDEITFKL